MTTVNIIVRDVRYYQFEIETDDPMEEIEYAEVHPDDFDISEGEELIGWNGMEFVSGEVME